MFTNCKRKKTLSSALRRRAYPHLSPYFLTREERRVRLTTELIFRYRRIQRRSRLKRFTAPRNAATELTRRMNRGLLFCRILGTLFHPVATLRRTLTRTFGSNKRRIRLRRMCAKLNPTA